MYMYTVHVKIRVDSASPVPAVRQIVDQIRVLLVDGSLQPGVSLPSVRRVAMELSVHFNTVAEAYRQLADEGWLELRHGRAAEVIERAGAKAGPAERENFRGRMRNLVAEMRARGLDAAGLADELRALANEVNK